MFRTAAMLTVLLCAVASAQTTRPAPQPTRVTVKLTNATIDEACRELSRVSGIPLRLSYQKKEERRITMDHTNAPLLEVLADFMRQAPATPNNHSATLSYRFYPYESLRYELVEPTVLVITRVVLMDAVAPADPAQKKQYNYNVQMTLIFDPSRQIVATQQLALIDELVPPVSAPRAYSGALSPNAIDARRLGLYECELRLSSETPIERIDKARLRVRAWQAVEYAELNFVDEQLIEGGKQEARGVTAEMKPQSAQGSLRIKLTGELIKQYKDYPWSGGLGSMLWVDNPNLPIESLACQVRPQDEGVEITLGLNQEHDRQLFDLLVQLGLRIPAKVRATEIPIELRDLPMPGR